MCKGKQGSLVLATSHASRPTPWVPLPSLPNTPRLQKLQGVRAEEGGWWGSAPQLEPQGPWTTSGVCRELIPVTESNPNVPRGNGARWPIRGLEEVLKALPPFACAHLCPGPGSPASGLLFTPTTLPFSGPGAQNPSHLMFSLLSTHLLLLPQAAAF